MKEKDKELLFKDICTRLPYEVKAYVRHYSKLGMKWYEGIYTIKSACPHTNEIYVASETGSVDVLVGYDDYEIKPYLFPMSSMTEEQEKELYKVFSDEADLIAEHLKSDISGNVHTHRFNHQLSLNWYLKNHFDIHNLIPMGLAIDATNKNIY